MAYVTYTTCRNGHPLMVPADAEPRCPICVDDGLIDPCPTCGGSRVIHTDRPGATSPRPCPACTGVTVAPQHSQVSEEGA